jgi:hypothetical protein
MRKFPCQYEWALLNLFALELMNIIFLLIFYVNFIDLEANRRI